MAPSANEELQKLRNIHFKMSQMGRMGLSKVEVPKEIYHDLVKIFSKFSHKISDLAKKINDEILSPSSSTFVNIKETSEDDSVLIHYQVLSNSLSKLAECSKRISSNTKQQVYEPMKVFVANYKGICDELLSRIIDNTTKISESQMELNKSKQHYHTVSQKLQKQKEMQSKVISKIQNGDKSELDKYNSQIKKLSDSIQQSQIVYKETISNMNEQWQLTRKAIDETILSYKNNEETRISFSKRFVLNTLKVLEDMQKGVTKDADAKLKQSEKSEKDKRSTLQNNKMAQIVKQVKSVELIQTFVSHEDHRKKQKRNEAIEQEHLQQIFKKVRNEDKEKIKQFVQSWFDAFEDQDEDETSIASNSSSNHNSPTRGETLSNGNRSKRSIKAFEGEEEKLDDIKGRIIEALPYSFYFIEELYNQVLNMSSLYCKLNDQNFYYILNTFTVVTKSLDIQSPNDITSEFLFKMVFISQRISWKKNNNSHQNKNFQLLSAHYSKNKEIFNNKKTIMAIFNYLIRKKSESKKSNETPKNALSNFTKNIFSRKRDKQIILSPEDQFSCLTEMTNIMANFDVEKEISLTFIKESLQQPNNSRSTSFQYLKGIILSKKDIEQRRKIFFKTEVKEKREKKLRKIIETKKVAEFCILVTAKRGFFSRDQLNLRMISKYLINVHWQILAHLKIQTPKKWLHLIPYNKKLHYIDMKQEVAQKSVPSATEEIITLDVNRSLHIHGQTLTPTVLHTLLRVYAFYNKEISYCQGMNYIAGYIYLKTLNEESAFRIFEYLMQIRFRELFVNEFEVLKVKMYQFDRLLSIFHPQINEHFKKQCISPECYIVSWIITLFASSYQYTMQSYMIDTLWERFIIYGWKQFFRFVLWMFDLKKEELLELTYDRALHALGEIARSRFLLASDKQYKEEFSHIENVIAGMCRFEITQELLDQLASQYKFSK